MDLFLSPCKGGNKSQQQRIKISNESGVSVSHLHEHSGPFSSSVQCVVCLRVCLCVSVPGSFGQSSDVMPGSPLGVSIDPHQAMISLETGRRSATASLPELISHRLYYFIGCESTLYFVLKMDILK